MKMTEGLFVFLYDDNRYPFIGSSSVSPKDCLTVYNNFRTQRLSYNFRPLTFVGESKVLGRSFYRREDVAPFRSGGV